MSTELVNWEEKMMAEAAEAAATERPSIATIGLKSGVMTYQGQPVPDNRLVCIIVASAHENRWYEDPDFDPNNFKKPGCFALSLDGKDMAPHPNSSKPQAPTCAVCPKMKGGSSPKGGRGKACKEIRRLVLIPGHDLSPSAIGQAECARLTVSVTNVKHWSNFVNKLAAQYKRPPWAVVTTITVRPDPKSQFRIGFEDTDVVPQELLSTIYDRLDAMNQNVLIPYDAQVEDDEGEVEESEKF